MTKCSLYLSHSFFSLHRHCYYYHHHHHYHHCHHYHHICCCFLVFQMEMLANPSHKDTMLSAPLHGLSAVAQCTHAVSGRLNFHKYHTLLSYIYCSLALSIHPVDTFYRYTLLTHPTYQHLHNNTHTLSESRLVTGILMRAETQFRNYGYLDNQPPPPPPPSQSQSQSQSSSPFDTPSDHFDSNSNNTSANSSPSKILSLPGFAPLYQDLLLAQATTAAAMSANGPGLGPGSAPGQGLDGYDGSNEWDNGENDNDWGMGGGLGEGQVIGDGDYDLTPVEEDPQVTSSHTP